MWGFFSHACWPSAFPIWKKCLVSSAYFLIGLFFFNVELYEFTMASFSPSLTWKRALALYKQQGGLWMGAHGSDGCYRPWELEAQANLSLRDLWSFFISSHDISPLSGSTLLPEVSWPGSFPSPTVYGSSHLHLCSHSHDLNSDWGHSFHFRSTDNRLNTCMFVPCLYSHLLTRQVYIIGNRVFWPKPESAWLQFWRP